MIYSALLKANNKCFIGMKDWLFSDLKQSIYLADRKALLEDLNFKDFKADRPQANLFYGHCFKPLTKLCLIPVVTIMVDLLLLLVLAWGLIVGLCSSKTPLFFINLILAH